MEVRLLSPAFDERLQPGLDSDEIEVACDALWFVKSRNVADEAQESLWARLQTVCTGDFGGSARAELSADEADATFRSLRFCAERVALDEDEQRLLQRLEPRLLIIYGRLTPTR